MYKEFKGRYGSPRIALELCKRGLFTSKNRVARLMQRMGLAAVSYRKRSRIGRNRIFTESCRLGHEHPNDRTVGDRRLFASRWKGTPVSRTDCTYGSRFAIYKPTLPKHLGSTWSHPQHVPLGRSI
ncbi:MAG: transposase [Bacillaceae bacterium]|nr:transposase [Bacillaceae bacterium]